MARNSRPARTVIFFYSLSAEREIEASWGWFKARSSKSEPDNIRSGPPLRAQRSKPEPQKDYIAPIRAIIAPALFSHCIGDRMPDLVFQLGCRRARDGDRRAVALLAGFDQP